MQKKNFIYAMLCICAAFLFSGCGSVKEPVIIPAPTVSAVITSAPKEESNQVTTTIAPLENYEVMIYTLDPDSLEKVAVTALVETKDELTPELIVEQVVYAMEDEGFYLGINDIIINEASVRIDFKSDAAPVIDVGASVEGSIIDILAQSILDNLPQYKSIYISIEDGPYHSGHLEYELDEVYLGR